MWRARGDLNPGPPEPEAGASYLVMWQVHGFLHMIGPLYSAGYPGAFFTVYATAFTSLSILSYAFSVSLLLHQSS